VLEATAHRDGCCLPSGSKCSHPAVGAMSKASNIIGRMASARERAFFKIEQEADLQRYSRRLMRDGKMKDIAARLGGKVAKAKAPETDSSRHFEVLGEILQQKARVHDPHAASRQEFVRRLKGVPSRLSPEEVARWRSSRLGVMAMVGHVPRLSGGGRDRYGLHAATSAAVSLWPCIADVTCSNLLRIGVQLDGAVHQ